MADVFAWFDWYAPDHKLTVGPAQIPDVVNPTTVQNASHYSLHFADIFNLFAYLV